jgi:hypothetical protein
MHFVLGLFISTLFLHAQAISQAKAQSIAPLSLGVVQTTNDFGRDSGTAFLINKEKRIFGTALHILFGANGSAGGRIGGTANLRNWIHDRPVLKQELFEKLGIVQDRRENAIDHFLVRNPKRRTEVYQFVLGHFDCKELRIIAPQSKLEFACDTTLAIDPLLDFALFSVKEIAKTERFENSENKISPEKLIHKHFSHAFKKTQELHLSKIGETQPAKFLLGNANLDGVKRRLVSQPSKHSFCSNVEPGDCGSPIMSEDNSVLGMVTGAMDTAECENSLGVILTPASEIAGAIRAQNPELSNDLSL